MSLAAWNAALPHAADQLVTVVVEGDSTFAGEAASGVLYSPVTRIRERLAAEGINDGGHGVMNGSLDTSEVSGEPDDAGVLDEPTWNFADGQNLKSNYAGSTNTPGETYTAAVYGQRIIVTFARYFTASTIDVTVDGVTERIVIPARGTTGGSADTNWQAGGRYYKGGLTYGRHVVAVELVSGRLSCLISGTRNAGVVLNNFAARGEKATDVPWHQHQAWAGLVPTNAAPVIPATTDTAAGSLAPVLGIFAKGINDQQGNGVTDTSALYGAKAYDFARAFIHRGASAIICAPWFESANQSQKAAAYRAAAAQAAADSGATYLDLGTGGALAGYTEGSEVGGANDNPHLTAFAYELQGDYIADALLANYSGPANPGGIPGRTIIGYRLGGQERDLIEFRRPTV